MIGPFRSVIASICNSRPSFVFERQSWEKLCTFPLKSHIKTHLSLLPFHTLIGPYSISLFLLWFVEKIFLLVIYKKKQKKIRFHKMCEKILYRGGSRIVINRLCTVTICLRQWCNISRIDLFSQQRFLKESICKSKWARNPGFLCGNSGKLRFFQPQRGRSHWLIERHLLHDSSSEE